MVMKKMIVPVIALALLLTLMTRKMKVKGLNILFVGDSHTAGFGWGWQDTLSKMYNFKVTNISVVGSTITGMFERLKNFFAKNSVPVTFIYLGANDIFNNKSVDKALSELQEMVNFAVSKGSKVVVISGFRSLVISEGKNKTFIENYDKFKTLLPSRIKNALVIPIWEDGKKSDSPDGYHINAQGQKRFAEYIGNRILQNEK
jgi:hypothetical protein